MKKTMKKAVVWLLILGVLIFSVPAFAAGEAAGGDAGYDEDLLYQESNQEIKGAIIQEIDETPYDVDTGESYVEWVDTDSYMMIESRISFDSLLEMMPQKLKVHMGGSETATEVSVLWQSKQNYEDSNEAYYEFYPVLSEETCIDDHILPHIIVEIKDEHEYEQADEVAQLQETVTSEMITSRINELVSKLNGKYFSTKGPNTGCKSWVSGHGCSYCLNSNVISCSWFKDMFGFSSLKVDQFPTHYYSDGEGTRAGYSCYGFANFAEWYIFRTSATSNVRSTKIGTYALTKANLSAYAKEGDILRFLNDGHSAIFISANSSNFTVLDCNSSGTYNCKVQKRTFSYNSSDKFTVSRAQNYPTDNTSTLKISPGSFPEGTYNTMDSYNLTGTVTSNYTINYFKGRIINFATGKEVMEYHYNPNSTKVYIADSAVNQNLKFGNLSNGIYYLCYYAEDTSGAEYSWDSKSTPFGKGKATITWNANGGNASSASTTKLYCDKIGTLPTATRSGYSFDGWYTAASGGTKITTSTLVTGAATYYAHWTSVSYTVKYNQNVDNGKIMDIADQTKTKDQDLKLSTVVPARNGYTFAGWATSAGGSVTYKPGDTYKNNADVTLYAVWTKNAKSPEKVTYNGHTYQIFDFTAEGSWKTWDEAKAYCEAQGGHLAAITTSEEDLFLYDYIKKSGYNSVYFGLTNTSGSWKWVTGEAFSYCDWATGQPSGGTEHYGTYWWSLGGKWNDADGKTNKNVLAYLCEWDTAEYTNNIHLWASGFKNQEGNSNDKSALDIGTTAFTKSYQDKYVLTASYNKTEIPNGYYLDTTRWGSRQYTGDSSWKWYEMGKDEVTQPAQGAWIEYDCHPYEYSITYNLNGGTNNAENPAKYTVLYGVSFKDPSRDGYSFTGWTDGSGKKITGINEGQNASFASAEDMISKLKTRTTGNVTVTANWEKNSTVEPVPITITSIKCENGAVVLAWQPQSGVDGYRVHKKTGSGKWTTLVASTTATTYTDTAVTEGTTYTYTVRSFVGSEYSTGYNDTAKSIKVTSGTAAEPSPVAITSIKCVNGAVVLAWQPQSGVDGYRVHKKTGSGKWTTLVASTTAATYTDTAVTEGTTYTYTVRSFVGSEYSTGYNDTAKSIKVTSGSAVEPSPVAITSIKCVNGAVVLAWQPQSGVDGYRVHKKTGSGKWTTLVASTTATTYTDTAVTEGTTYTYTVRSFVGSEYSTGYNDTAKSIKVTGAAVEPSPVAITSIKCVNGAVVLAWQPQSGVDGYRVHKKTGSGKWTTLVASTTATAYTDTAVTEGTTYTYTVRSFVGSEYSTGYNDTAKSIKVTSGTSSEPPAVTISSIQSTGGMVVLSWNAAPGVDGYRVYRKTGSGKWTTVCASTTDTMFIDTNVTAGTTYTYTLRSFIGSTYSSGYNDTAKSIKAK